MNCFNHQNKESVGICKSCNKALCSDCAVDTGTGLACRGKCEKDLKAIAELIEFNKDNVKKIKKVRNTAQIIIFIAIVFGGIFYLKIFDSNKQKENDNVRSLRAELYDRTELGIVNTFEMDTVILKTRKIYFNYDFNELSCAWLIKLLWLLDSKSTAPIDLYVCSSGGYISEAKSIGNTIHELKSKVNTYATGCCASSALRTVAYGTGIRAAFCNTILMFHGSEYKDSLLDHSYDAIAKGVDLSDWQRISKISEKMTNDTTEYNLTPQKAVEMGFVDTVICW
jgi:ATP-dependent protease ClpP protease subunit